MSGETVVRYFTSRVDQEFDKPPLRVHEIPADMILMQLVFGKLFGSVQSDGTRPVITSAEIIAAKQFMVPYSSFLLPSERDSYTKELEDFLSGEMHIPENEQPLVIEKIFQAAEEAEFPGPPIVGLITDFTVRILQDIEERIEFTPATKSSIESLEKLRLDNLEASIKKMQCVICKEDLDCSDNAGVEEGINDGRQPAIARLPCLHLYHTACIVQWLETCHLCPICRYPLPTTQEEMVREPPNPLPTTQEEMLREPPKPSGRRRWRLHLPVVLTLSAGSVLTAMLLCRLLKQRGG